MTGTESLEVDGLREAALAALIPLDRGLVDDPAVAALVEMVRESGDDIADAPFAICDMLRDLASQRGLSPLRTIDDLAVHVNTLADTIAAGGDDAKSLAIDIHRAACALAAA